MEKFGIVCGIHYPALHLNSIYNGGKKLDCPMSKKLEHRTVSLPVNEKLTFFELEYVIDKVKEYI
jgi:dTDP-4-amino-4,6-dideoxygalactose transaminase